MPVSGSISARLALTVSQALDLGTAAAKQTFPFDLDIASGTGDAAGDVLWSDTRTLSASASEDLDFTAGLTNALGATVVMVEILAIAIKADAGNTNDVLVGDATAPVINGPFGADGSQVVPVKPGGLFLWVAPGDGDGITVTDSTAEDLKVANSSSGTGVTYTIVVVGRSA